MKIFYTYLYPRLQSNAGCLSFMDGQFCLGKHPGKNYLPFKKKS